MGIKVCKFGGTSLATATNILKVKDIINAEESRKFVVVSAPGKRYSEDIKITDLLYQCAKAAREEGSCKKVCRRFWCRVLAIHAPSSRRRNVVSVSSDFV